MTDADPLKGLIAFLKAAPGVSALVGTRVFGDELPAKEVSFMPRKCIVIEPSGSAGAFGTAYQDYGDGRYDVRSYGETPHEAALLDIATYRALKNLRRGVNASVLLHWVKRAGGPIPMRDPDTGWPFRFASYQLLAAEVEVT